MVAGAFAGFVGEVESLSGEGVRVLIDIMGQAAHVELRHELESIGYDKTALQIGFANCPYET